MNQLKIVGIAGTDGAGKDTVAEALVDHGWLYVSVTDMLREEATKRNLPLSRKNLRDISAEWRRQQGLGVLVDMALEEYKKRSQTQKFGGLVLASLRHPGEADRVQELGGQVVWVDADPKVRYERIMARKRGSEDKVTFEEFQAEEATQMNQSGDKATLSLSEVKAKADIMLENNGNDLAVFKKTISQTLGL